MQIRVPTFFFSSSETPPVLGKWIPKLPSLITSRQSEHPEAFHSARVCWFIYWTWTELEICSSSSTQKLILNFFSSLADFISGNIRIWTYRLEVIDTLHRKRRKNFLRGCVDIYFCTPALTHSMTMYEMECKSCLFPLNKLVLLCSCVLVLYSILPTLLKASVGGCVVLESIPLRLCIEFIESNRKCVCGWVYGKEITTCTSHKATDEEEDMEHNIVCRLIFNLFDSGVINHTRDANWRGDWRMVEEFLRIKGENANHPAHALAVLFCYYVFAEC